MSRKAIIYAAKSTRDRHGAIPEQLAHCRGLAEAEGLEVVGEFTDEGFSAYSGSRGRGLTDAFATAEEHAPCSLIVVHSDRLARGDGKRAMHLVEYAAWALKNDVALRSVQDDRTFFDLPAAANQGQRNTEDSDRKSKATKAGLDKKVRKDARWRGGILPEGYDAVYEVDDRGRPVMETTEDGQEYQVKCVVKRPDEEDKIGLIFDLYRQGRSYAAIVAELNRRGMMTRPRRKAREPVPFSVRRVARIVTNPFYSGRQNWHRDPETGKYEVHGGAWPAYIEPDEHDRLVRARRPPGKSTRGKGRSASEYLLSGIAVCGSCGGPVHCITGPRPRKDGTRPRRYACHNHRTRRPDDPQWCATEAWSADEVEAYCMQHIEAMLGDAESIARQLEAGRRADRARLGQEAEGAKADAAKADRRAEQAEADYAATEDPAERKIAMRQAVAAREDAVRARELMDAALDALAQEEDPAPAGDPMAHLREALEGGEGMRWLNIALRETFDAFFLKPGSPLCAPVFKGETLVAEIMQGREPTDELVAALKALALAAPDAA